MARLLIAIFCIITAVSISSCNTADDHIYPEGKVIYVNE
jgi:hypothetical protein